MGDRIEFPLNGKIYFKKGTEAFQQGKEEEAIKYLDKSFEYTRNEEVNLYYAFVLSVYRRHEDALEVMNRTRNFYINSETHASFYAEILIKNNKFLEAEYIIQKYKLNPATVHGESWEKLEQELNDDRELYNLEEEARKKEVIRSLRELEKYPISLQYKKVGNAEALDLLDLQELAETILVNYQLNEKIRRAYLEILIRHKDEKTYSFLWFDQIKTVRPSELLMFGELPIIHETKDLLDEKLDKFPDLYFSVEVEIMNDLLLVYPYIDETIKDLDFWIDLYINKLDFFNYIKTSRIAVTKEQLEMKEMVNFLHIISQRGKSSSDK